MYIPANILNAQRSIARPLCLEAFSRSSISSFPLIFPWYLIASWKAYSNSARATNIMHRSSQVSMHVIDLVWVFRKRSLLVSKLTRRLIFPQPLDFCCVQHWQCWQASRTQSRGVPFVPVPPPQEWEIQWRKWWSTTQWGGRRSYRTALGFVSVPHWIQWQRILLQDVERMFCQKDWRRRRQTLPWLECHHRRSNLFRIPAKELKSTPLMSTIRVGYHLSSLRVGTISFLRLTS